MDAGAACVPEDYGGEWPPRAGVQYALPGLGATFERHPPDRTRQDFGFPQTGNPSHKKFVSFLSPHEKQDE